MVVSAIAVIVFTAGTALGPITAALVMAAKGVIVGSTIGGLVGGTINALAGDSFFEGFEDGAFGGAIAGGLTGGIGTWLSSVSYTHLLKALIEAIYYGLKKSNKFEEHFALLEYYLKTRKEVQVLYNAKGDFNVIDFTEKYKTEDGNEQSIFNKKLDELGFATSSCLLFTTNTIINPQPLFKKSEKSYILSVSYTHLVIYSIIIFRLICTNNTRLL